MQFCAKLVKIIEEAIFRGWKVQFFSWSSVEFFLNVHNFQVRELCKISPLGDVFPYKFIGLWVILQAGKWVYVRWIGRCRRFKRFRLKIDVQNRPMGHFAGWFLCILLIYSIFAAFKIPKNATNEQEKVPSVRGGQNKEKWYTQRRTTVQMFSLPTSVS